MKLKSPIVERGCGHLDDAFNVEQGQPCEACQPAVPGADPVSWRSCNLLRGLVEALRLDMSDSSLAARITGEFGEFDASDVRALRGKLAS